MKGILESKLAGFFLAAAIFLVMWAFRFESLGTSDGAAYVVNRWTGSFYFVRGTAVYRTPLSSVRVVP